MQKFNIMENTKIDKSLCCRTKIDDYAEYGLKVCGYCKTQIHVNTKPTTKMKMF